ERFLNFLQQTAQVDTEKEGNGIKFEDPSKYYEYLCLLGKGEYGQVFKVMDRRDGQVNNEVNFMQDINHRNITNLIEVYYWHEQLYVFMELCGGGSLFGLCYKTGPFNEQEIAYITKQCLQGLHYIHGKGYMHRDLKIENILLTEAGEVKICDFGLVEKMENKTAVIVGTEVTRAPEVSMAEERGSYDERCDIWSLGISVLDLAEYIWITNTENIWSEDFKSFVRSRQRQLRRRVFSIQEHPKKHISRETETMNVAKQKRLEKLHISCKTETMKEAQQRLPENQNIMHKTETAKESQPNSFEKNNVSHKTETKKRTLQRIKKVWKPALSLAALLTICNVSKENPNPDPIPNFLSMSFTIVKVHDVHGFTNLTSSEKHFIYIN
uniref:Protein kinase domain-containing protein n=1 Tax=Denticeps clupeoides TaxID=299321 RepID=A0AAY4DPF3_9TELE